jgi:hypothetical protein
LFSVRPSRVRVPVDKSSVPPAAIVVVPEPLIVPPVQASVPPLLTFRFPAPVRPKVNVSVPPLPTVSVAPALMVTVDTVAFVVSVGWLPPLLIVTVSPACGVVLLQVDQLAATFQAVLDDPSHRHANPEAWEGVRSAARAKTPANVASALRGTLEFLDLE